VKTQTTAPTGSRRGRDAVAGIVATLAAIGVSELIAGILTGAPSLVASIGQSIIDRQPPGAKDFVVSLFGTNDKLAFEILIVVIALAIGAGLGILARSRFGLAAGIFAIFGVVGFLASLEDPLGNPSLAATSTAVSVGVGLWVLGWLLGPRGKTQVGDPDYAPAGKPTSGRSISTKSRAVSMPDWSRRSFIIRAGGVGAAAVVAGLAGRQLLERQTALPVNDGSAVPPASVTVPPLDPTMDISTTVSGVTPIVEPNDRFYRIDTNLITPSVDAATWTVRIHGLVDRETTLSWNELIALPLFEQYVTIACVSNEVGGNLVGNAKWTGVRLRDVLDIAGVQTSATQLVGRSVDGWTAGMPMAWVQDPDREPMIAVKMNDAPLPKIHGYPARLIVPGLYGYVSATKWLAELELTTLEAFNGYWIERGWAKNGPILTQSRIDTPRGGVSAGTVPIAGIAWAPDRGIAKVEVGIDGTWSEARLSQPISDATWVQWVLDWSATPGNHTISVRATDRTGETQPEQPTTPAPDGARGWHTISVNVG
jgi:DMSO/TMAO reductase YedYZ molybdopterin-dependent catalytic subunit